MSRRALAPAALLAALGFLGRGPALAQDAPAAGYGYAAALGGDLDKAVGESIGKARKFLLSQRDEGSGAFGAKTPIAAGLTALGALALIGTTPRESVANDPTIGGSLDFLAKR